jgi:hypothetical protein
MTMQDTAFHLDSIDSIEGLDDFDVTQALTSDAAIAAYISDVISSGDQPLIKQSGTFSRSRAWPPWPPSPTSPA